MGMTVDLLPETLNQVILGGALIGLAIGLLRILTGRVMSASGMVGSLLGGGEGPAAASIAFLAGLFIAPSVLIALGVVAALPVEAGWPLLCAGGVLVGLGARLGNGGVVGSVFGLTQRSGQAGAAILAIIAGAGAALVLGQLVNIGGAA